MDGKNQENLTEVLWQHLQPYILYYVYVHVYIRSTNMYCISPYPVPVGVRASYSGNEKSEVNSLENGSIWIII